jgi:serine/threonine-protein kinase
MLVGQLFDGRYDVTAVLAEGGMGMILEATDRKRQMKVALKVLYGAFRNDYVTGARLQREGRAVMAIQHPNVCSIWRLGTLESGVPYLVMERLSGETLGDRLRRQKCLGVPEAVAIFAQVLSGLAAAHAIGVLHRDVKPGNIFLLTVPGEGPRVKLLDFGLAKMIRRPDNAASSEEEQEDHADLTAMGEVVGTAFYMSPEQVRGLDLDERVDVWGVGVTLYEALTGRRAFHSEDDSDVAAVMRRIALHEPLPAKAFRSDLSPALRDVLDRAMRKKPSDRFATVREFRDALLASS